VIEILHQVKKIKEGLAQLEALIYAHRERHQLGGGDPLELDASQVISGTFDVARIPDLDASKITTGNFSLSLLPSSDNLFDIGSSSYGWRDLHIKRDVYLYNLPEVTPTE